jgi:hypothetical protein
MSATFGMPSGGTKTVEPEDDEQEQEGRQEVLPDDAQVDVETERKETNTDEVLERLDRELVGLVPVKTRIRESPTSW